MIKNWPYALKMRSCVFHPVNGWRSGGSTLTNAGQVVISPSGCWRASVTVAVYDEDSALAYQSLQGGMIGFASDVLVPRLSLFRPRDANGRMAPLEIEAGIDGRPLWDHTGLAGEEEPLFFFDQAAPLRATRLRLRHPGTPPLRAGHFFGIRDRLHTVVNAWIINWERRGVPDNLAFWGDEPFTWLDGTATVWGGASATGVAGENILGVDIWPPLREPVLVGEPLILGRPVCKMRAASSETGELDMGAGFYGETTIEFIEVP